MKEIARRMRSCALVLAFVSVAIALADAPSAGADVILPPGSILSRAQGHFCT
jgi:hypothetical protein